MAGGLPAQRSAMASPRRRGTKEKEPRSCRNSLERGEAAALAERDHLRELAAALEEADVALDVGFLNLTARVKKVRSRPGS